MITSVVTLPGLERCRTETRGTYWDPQFRFQNCDSTTLTTLNSVFHGCFCNCPWCVLITFHWFIPQPCPSGTLQESTPIWWWMAVAHLRPRGATEVRNWKRSSTLTQFPLASLCRNGSSWPIWLQWMHHFRLTTMPVGAALTQSLGVCRKRALCQPTALYESQWV